MTKATKARAKPAGHVGYTQLVGKDCMTVATSPATLLSAVILFAHNNFALSAAGETLLYSTLELHKPLGPLTAITAPALPLGLRAGVRWRMML
jgi:hypothetical protein